MLNTRIMLFFHPLLVSKIDTSKDKEKLDACLI